MGCLINGSGNRIHDIFKTAAVEKGYLKVKIGIASGANNNKKTADEKNLKET